MPEACWIPEVVGACRSVFGMPPKPSKGTDVRGSVSEDDAAAQGVRSDCPLETVCFPTILRFGTGFCTGAGSKNCKSGKIIRCGSFLWLITQAGGLGIFDGMLHLADGKLQCLCIQGHSLPHVSHHSRPKSDSLDLSLPHF